MGLRNRPPARAMDSRSCSEAGDRSIVSNAPVIVSKISPRPRKMQGDAELGLFFPNHSTFGILLLGQLLIVQIQPDSHPCSAMMPKAKIDARSGSGGAFEPRGVVRTAGNRPRTPATEILNSDFHLVARICPFSAAQTTRARESLLAFLRRRPC
jgi:hypothetical protein